MNEDPDERRMFDHHAKIAGGPLMAISWALRVWAKKARVDGSYAKVLTIYANECEKAAETSPVRQALNRAARIVEEEALLFYEAAAKLMPDTDNAGDWEHHDVVQGKALSLRKLANTIRTLKP